MILSLRNMRVLSITMKDLLKTVEIFLTYSEAKLEELSEKNQKLKTDVPRKEGVKKQA